MLIFDKAELDRTATQLGFIRDTFEKEYRPELLFDDEEIICRLYEHPMALWKCR